MQIGETIFKDEKYGIPLPSSLAEPHSPPTLWRRELWKWGKAGAWVIGIAGFAFGVFVGWAFSHLNWGGPDPQWPEIIGTCTFFGGLTGAVGMAAGVPFGIAMGCILRTLGLVVSDDRA